MLIQANNLTAQMTEPKETPCMYGKEIREKCTVRIELSKGSSSDISKWVKPKNNTVFDDAEKIIDVMGNVNNALVSFCELCPYLALYMDKQSNNP